MTNLALWISKIGLTVQKLAIGIQLSKVKLNNYLSNTTNMGVDFLSCEWHFSRTYLSCVFFSNFFRPKPFLKEFFWPQYFLDQTYFWTENFSVITFFPKKNFCKPTDFLGPQILLTKYHSAPKNLEFWKRDWPQKFCNQNFFTKIIFIGFKIISLAVYRVFQKECHF